MPRTAGDFNNKRCNFSDAKSEKSIILRVKQSISNNIFNNLIFCLWPHGPETGKKHMSIIMSSASGSRLNARPTGTCTFQNFYKHRLKCVAIPIQSYNHVHCTYMTLSFWVPTIIHYLLFLLLCNPSISK